jgi:hypothetical protein
MLIKIGDIETLNDENPDLPPRATPIGKIED